MRIRDCLAALFAALAVGGCSITPAEEDPVQVRLNDLDSRLTRIEKIMANQNLFELANDIESIRADLRGLRNETDQLGQSSEALRKQQRDLYADLDQRLKSLEPKQAGAPDNGSVEPPAAAPATRPGPSSGSDREAYQAAFNLLKDSQYGAAIGAFQQFIATYPSSALIDNAHYWLGEAYYVNRSFTDALAAFQSVVDDFPGSRKLPDAMLKVGFCQYELKQWPQARATLQQVVDRFGESAAGKLASQRLDKMKSEGR